MRDGHLEETLRRIIAQALLDRVKDPRIAFVTINEVRLNRDRSIAQVFYTVMGTEDERRKSHKGLRSCASFLQGIIGDSLRLRTVPKLHFRYDDSLDRSFRLEKLLGELHPADGDRSPSASAQGETDAPASNRRDQGSPASIQGNADSSPSGEVERDCGGLEEGTA